MGKPKYPVIDGFKICTRCVENLPIDKFRFAKKTNYYHSWCKPCESESAKINRYKDQAVYEEKKRLRNLRNKERRLDPEIRPKLLEYAMSHYNKSRNRAKFLGYSRKAVVELTDSYIIGVLCNKTKISKDLIPQEMIELQRQKLKLQRIVKQTKNGKENTVSCNQ